MSRRQEEPTNDVVMAVAEAAHVAEDNSRDVYGLEIGPENRFAEQPAGVRIPLKPHQRAALHKANIMETRGKLYYHLPPSDPTAYMYMTRNHIFRGRFEIESNIGVLGDIVGYGKTLTALSIIASTPARNIFHGHRDVYSCNTRTGYSHFVGTYDRADVLDEEDIIHCTLIVVPRGPVYVQWEKAIREQTNLKVLAIESLPYIRKELPPPDSTRAQLQAFFEQYDIVLIKSTTLKSFMSYYEVPYREHPIKAWSRIMIDEAPDIINTIPLFGFRFLWLISATYECLLYRTYASRHLMSFAIRDIINEERLRLLLIKGQRDFVMQSFSIPQAQEHYYLCEMPAQFAAVHSFLHPSVQERLNANDIPGVIRELGGTHETEEDIVSLLTREIERDIRNKEREIEYIQNIELPEDAREQRLLVLNRDLSRMQDRRQNLMDRVTALAEKTCPICYENYKNPIVLPCTHVFCGECLLHWMQSGHACPECRTPIQSRKLIAVVKEKPTRSGASAPPTPRILSKEDTLIKLLRDKPHGKFLVFSRCDSTFTRLTHKLAQEGITHMEIKGSTASMMHILERFRNGSLRVILLNTYHAGSGIDISCATDVVIFHSMGLDKTQAVGRAQRVGRRETLHIHNLCYPNEMMEGT